MNVIERMQHLYSKKSKHSNYQLLPKRLRGYFSNQLLETKSRHEESRLQFITEAIEVKGKSILDIGGNIGFFTFEMLERGALSGVIYEGNKEHAEFMKLAAEVLGFSGKISVINEYFNFNHTNTAEKYDIALLMNVLHHLGDDFGNTSISIEEARQAMVEALNNMSYLAEYLVFQIGYCWKGNPNYLLFEKGTKEQQIKFIQNAIPGYWEIIKIGIPEMEQGKPIYKTPSKKNLERKDYLGEFLNRPLFLLKSQRRKR